VVVGEGIKDTDGHEVGADKTRLDAFGHPVLAGAAEELKEVIQGKMNLKTRTVLLGYTQRAAAHYASLTDTTNGFACGEAAVRAAVAGQSGFMVKIVRNLQGDGSVRWTTDLQPLGDIANVEHFIPKDWISEDGLMVNEKFVEYASPLVEGEVHVPTEGGLPKYVVLEKNKVEKKLPPRA
jgi:6-phosphofructokinase 1